MDRRRRTLVAGLPALASCVPLAAVLGVDLGMALACGTAKAAATTPTAGSTVPAPAFLAEYERSSGGRAGLLARNLATGARIAWRADERFVMCSTFKASLAALVLSRVDRHEDELSAHIPIRAADLLEYAPAAREAAGSMSVDDMCEAMVEISDNTCANLLLARVGGPAALTAFWRSVGDATSRLDHNEPELNRSPPGDPHDTTTPSAMAGVLQQVLLGDVLLPASRARLRGWMADCQTGARRLRAGLPAGRTIENKTGNNGRDAAGDIGLVWGAGAAPTVVCLYTQGGNPTAAQTDALFAAAGRAVAEL